MLKDVFLDLGSIRIENCSKVVNFELQLNPKSRVRIQVYFASASEGF